MWTSLPRTPILLFLAVFTLLCTVRVALAQVTTNEALTWFEATNPNALCNDRTRAGFFLKRNNNSNKWVIFLESGSLCFSTDTCNRRFFVQSVRNEFEAFAPEGAPSFPPYGSFDPQRAWDSTINKTNPRNFADVINPLMSSMQCFRNSSQYFPDKRFEIYGRDILDSNPNINELFADHNHVVIPYCSSDIWLGEETNGSECSCFDYNCFNFNPSSPELQFTYRGKTIFQSIFTQLLDDHGLDNSTEVVLSGSSAGGVGVVNHAQWVQQQLEVRVVGNTRLLVIFDSSWFINFQDSIFRIFDGTVNQAQSEAERANTRRLLSVISRHPPCNDTSLGYPCCVSAQCMFTRVNATGSPLYFPSSIRAFAISSIYDPFLLAPATQQVLEESRARSVNATRSIGSTAPDENAGGFDFIINFLRLIGEYGGAMNTTFTKAVNQADNLAFYVPQCVQHIYLATSTLWGTPGSSVFGNSAIESDLNTGGLAQLSHTIASGRWNTSLLALNPSKQNSTSRDITIHDALLEWYLVKNTSRTSPYQFRANCQGPYCYDRCPDSIDLSSLMSNNWHPGAKVAIAVVIIGIAAICLLMKMLFVIWLFWLERKQDAYLDSLEVDLENDEGVLQFPYCVDEDAISVSCLDVNYSVSFRAKKAVKDEKKDQTAPVVLNDIAESSDEEDLLDEFITSRRGYTTRRRGGTSSKRLSQLPQLAEFRSRLSSAADRRHRFSRKSDVDPNKVLIKTKSSNGLSTSSELLESPGEQKKLFGYREKAILKGISIYFNPGEMIGVMGPSGCGKTTFLDIMTARRKTGNFTGEIYVNGIPINEIRDWYVANTGYVLQLATPYYEELTVRENVTLAAQIKLPKSFTVRQKFERAEQVMEVSGLSKLAETVVGGATGPGLSGGQKKRLAIALQLLKLPSVIFLDEPTSGLDSTSSFELLTHLNKLADSNRTVILTIHQPRLEIFHMFHRLVLLSDGRVSYHGAPEKAYEVFVNALTSRFLEQGLVIPELENHNPADVIMDMLGNQKMRQIITEHYHASAEPRLVRRAITAARWKEYSTSTGSMDTISGSFSYAIFGAKKVSRRQPSLFTRMATLEARGAKRSFNLFLPFMFFAFGFVLGTVYLQQTMPILIISGVCVFSVASGLFMFPAMYPYYQRALEVYTYERADGVGRSADLVLQGFIRFNSIAILPVILSSTILYLMVINAKAYDIFVYLQVVLVNIALSQTWISMLIALICALPDSAFRVSSGISSVAGFTSGFFIPVEQLGWWWRWLVYINPNYYAVSSVSFFVLSDFNAQDCVGSEFVCFLQSGVQILRQFNFDMVNPYLHLLIILVFTIFYLFLAVFANWVRHTAILSKLTRLKTVLSRKSGDTLSKEFDKNRDEFARSFSEDKSLDEIEPYEELGEEENPVNLVPVAPLSPIGESDEDEKEIPSDVPSKARTNWKVFANRSLDRLELEEQETAFQEASPATPTNKASGWTKVKRVRIKDHERPTNIPLKPRSPKLELSAYLREGDSHRVWRPKKAPQLADLVSDLIKREKAGTEPVTPVATKAPKATTPGQRPPTLSPSVASKGNLRSRQRTLFTRVLATQAVLKETTDELLNEEEEQEEGATAKPHLSLFEASKKITDNIKKQRSEEGQQKGDEFSSVVSKYLTTLKSNSVETQPSPSETQPSEGFKGQRKTRRGSKRNAGVIPLAKWKNLAREHKKHGGWVQNRGTQRSATEYPFANLPLIEEAGTPSSRMKHKPLDRSVSDPETVMTEEQRRSNGSTFGITLVDSQPSPTAKGSDLKIQLPGDVDEPGVGPTSPPIHQPIMKQDSHGIIKKSKLAQLKGKGAGVRRSTGLNRQGPVDFEVSLTSKQGDTASPNERSRSASPGEKLLLDNPPKTTKDKLKPHKEQGRSPHTSTSSLSELPHTMV